MRPGLSFLFGLFAVAVSTVGHAHEVRPAYLELRETSAGTYAVLWKVPARGDLRLGLYARFPDTCSEISPRSTYQVDGAFIDRSTVACGGGLAGYAISIDGLRDTRTDALVRVEHAGGAVQTARLTPAAPSVVVEAIPGAMGVARTYFALGVEHILLGIDHLLFVLALLLITRGTWRLIKTVTAFTVAHSVTLALAALGVVHVPQAPVEAIIALSIVFVAAEILRARRGVHGITARAPWVVAFVFGLLHGFGFAGALSETGLPANHIPLALLLFNLGVEAGQLLFIAAVLGLLALGQRAAMWSRNRPGFSTNRLWDSATPTLVTAYAIGSVAMFWVIERVSAF